MFLLSMIQKFLCVDLSLYLCMSGCVRERDEESFVFHQFLHMNPLLIRVFAHGAPVCPWHVIQKYASGKQKYNTQCGLLSHSCS